MPLKNGCSDKQKTPATLLQRCTLSIPKHYRFHKEKVASIILNTLQQTGIAGKKREHRCVAVFVTRFLKISAHKVSSRKLFQTPSPLHT